jgi:3-hydroxyacyl-CoA dehydrogenase
MGLGSRTVTMPEAGDLVESLQPYMIQSTVTVRDSNLFLVNTLIRYWYKNALQKLEEDELETKICDKLILTW